MTDATRHSSSCWCLGCPEGVRLREAIQHVLDLYDGNEMGHYAGESLEQEDAFEELRASLVGVIKVTG